MVEEHPTIRIYMSMVQNALKSTARKIWLRMLTALGIVAAIAVAWWMKVEDARAPVAPPQIAFGEPVNVGRAVFIPYKLVIEEPSATGPQAGRKIVLTGQIENVTGSSQLAVFGSPEKLPALSSGGVSFPAPQVYLFRDKELLRQLQPRIRELVSIVWDVPEGWDEQDVTIGFSTQQFKLKDNLYAKASWLQSKPSGTLSARPERGA